MEWKTKNGLLIGHFPALRVLSPELCVFVTSRIGGKSSGAFESLNLGDIVGDDPDAVKQNRRLLLSALGISPRRIVRSNQAHGNRIAVVERGARLSGFDGLATSSMGLATVVSTADCYPVILHSPPERALINLHVGRMGAAAGIIQKAVGLLKRQFHADPRSAIAVIGPGICRRCYSVSRKEAMQFPAWARSFFSGSWHLDLEQFIARSLLSAGFEAKNIIRSRLCTACRKDLFFSHRRDAGKTGRHWTIAFIDRPWAASERLLDSFREDKVNVLK